MTHQIIDTIRQDHFWGVELSDFAERALRETLATGSAIALKQGEQFVCCASAGETAPGVGAVVDSDSGLTGTCIRSGMAVICADTLSDPRVDGAACEELGIASVIAVPVVRSGATIGVIEALSREPDAFGPVQQALLGVIARKIGEHHSPADKAEPIDSATHESEQVSDGPETAPVDRLEVDAAPSPAFDYSARPAEEKRRIRRFALLPMAVTATLGAGVLLYSYFTHQPSTTVSGDAIGVGVARKASGPISPLRARRQPESDTLETSPASANLDSLERAARHGDVSAELELANRLANGSGIGKDLVLACAWYTLAAISGEQGPSNRLAEIFPQLSNNDVAQVRIQLGQMFSHGIGVKRDLTSAYTWFLLAAAAGSPEAQQQRQKLAAEMTSSQLAESRRRANEWLLQHQLAPLKD